MADDADEASARSEAERAALIARHLARPVGPGSSVCRRCGDEIPAARRAAVPEAMLCVDCADDLERRR